MANVVNFYCLFPGYYYRRLIEVIRGVQFRALLLLASADLALVLVGLVLVDLFTDFLRHRLAFLHLKNNLV